MSILLISAIASLSNFFFQDSYESKRLEMVKNQIESRGVANILVLNAMKKVPRHLFVLPEYKDKAYEDGPLPIGYEQTISQPYIVAYMTEAIDPQANDMVLEIGTGSGYQAAVLSEIVDQVFTLEIVPELGNEAAQRLKNLEYTNIHVRIGDGYFGWKEKSPFDAIIVTAAAEEVPQPLIDQLKEGGKMIIPIGPAFSIQNLMLFTKKDGKIVRKKLFPVRFVPFTRD